MPVLLLLLPLLAYSFVSPASASKGPTDVYLQDTQVVYNLSEATYESYLQENSDVFSFAYSLMVEPTQGVMDRYHVVFPYPVSNVTVTRAVESRVGVPLNYTIEAEGTDRTRVTVFFQKPLAFPGQQRFTLTAHIKGTIAEPGSDSRRFSFTTEDYPSGLALFNFKIFLPRGWVMDSHSSTMGDMYGKNFQYGEDPGTGGWLIRWQAYDWKGGPITLNTDYSRSLRLGQILWYAVASGMVAVMAVVAYVAINRWRRRLGYEEAPGEG